MSVIEAPAINAKPISADEVLAITYAARLPCRDGPDHAFAQSSIHSNGDSVRRYGPNVCCFLAPIMSFWVLIAFSLFAGSLVPICKG